MARYADQHATRVMREAEQYKRDAARLKRAIHKHFEQCHAGNWGYDDELWAEVGLEADPEVLG